MIAAKVVMVDLAVELNLPLSTFDRINKVFKKSLRIQTLLKGQFKMFLFLVLSLFKKSLRIQTLLKGQFKMFLFLVLSSSFLCLLLFFSVIRGRHVCLLMIDLSFLYSYFWSRPADDRPIFSIFTLLVKTC